MEKNEEQHGAVAVPDVGRHWQGAATHRRRQGQRAPLVAGRTHDRLHRQAAGRRRTADLRHRARRWRSAACDPLATGCAAPVVPPMASASRSSRRCGRTCERSRAGEAAQEGSSRTPKVKAHVTERGDFRFWDHWLTDGREPHIHVCEVATGTCRDVLAGTGIALPPWEPQSEDLRHRAGRARDRAHRRSRSRAADDEPVRHRDGRPRDAAPRVLTDESGMSDVHPITRPTAARWCGALRHQSRLQRPGSSHVLRQAQPAARRLAPRHDYRPARAMDGRQHARSCSCPKIARATGIVAPRHRRDGRGGSRADRGAAARSAASRRPATCSSTIARARMHPPALFAARADGSGERADRAPQPRPARASCARRGARIHDQGPRRRPGADVRRVPAELRPEAQAWPLLHSIHGGPHAAHLDTWHFRWNLHVVRGARLRRRRRELPRLLRLRPALARDRSPGATASRSSPTPRPPPISCCAGLHRPQPPRSHRRQLRRLHGRVHERPHAIAIARTCATPAATTG